MKKWRDRTDDELADHAEFHAKGQGAVVEASRRLRHSNEKLTWTVIALTLVLIILTGILAKEAIWPAPPPTIAPAIDLPG